MCYRGLVHRHIMKKIKIDIVPTQSGTRFLFKITFGNNQSVYFRNDKSFNLVDSSVFDWHSKRQGLSELSRYFNFYKIKCPYSKKIAWLIEPEATSPRTYKTTRYLYKATMKEKAIDTKVLWGNEIYPDIKTLGDIYIKQTRY